jgi:hypothetical protein
MRSASSGFQQKAEAVEADMNTHYARLSVRKTETPGEGTLVLGFNAGLLKEGMVYEIRNIMGQLVLAEVGPAAINNRGLGFGASWCNTPDQILKMGREGLWLTEEEWRKHHEYSR